MAVRSDSMHHGMPLPFVQPPASLCIVRLSAIGDTCHTVPVVRAIQDAWPSTQLTWIIGKTEHSLLRGLEGVELIVLDKARGLRGYAAVHRALGGRRFDALLHMHASARANMVSLLVRSRMRIGFDRARARDQQWLFTNHKLPARRERHVMDGLFEFAELIGVQRGKPRWDLPIGADDVAAIAPYFANGKPTLVISPCTGQRFRNYRNWRVESYAEIADYAAQRYGAQVLLTGGTTAIEESYGRDIAAMAARAKPTNLIGKTTLKQLVAILQRASVVLCPDSGPGAYGDGRRDPGRRPVRDVESPSDRPLLQPAPRRRQVPGSRRARVRPADRDAALGPARPRPGRDEPDYGSRCHR